MSLSAKVSPVRAAPPKLVPVERVRFDGRYRVDAKLVTTDTMSRLYKATLVSQRRVVALKIYPNDSHLVAREAEVLRTLHHPSFVTLVESQPERKRAPFLTMDWVPGEDLATALARGRRFDALEMATLTWRLLQGLVHAHTCGVVHRDLKPSNVMLRAGKVERPIIADLGLGLLKKARHAIEEPAGTLSGTTRYMSPEQVRGLPLDSRSDVFALGVTLYECMTGRPPFEGETDIEIMMAICAGPRRPLTADGVLADLSYPHDLLELVECMLVTDRDLRPYPEPLAAKAGALCHASRSPEPSPVIQPRP